LFFIGFRIFNPGEIMNGLPNSSSDSSVAGGEPNLTGQRSVTLYGDYVLMISILSLINGVITIVTGDWYYIFSLGMRDSIMFNYLGLQYSHGNVHDPSLYIVVALFSTMYLLSGILIRKTGNKYLAILVYALYSVDTMFILLRRDYMDSLVHLFIMFLMAIALLKNRLMRPLSSAGVRVRSLNVTIS
jgi:hypothetical protein